MALILWILNNENSTGEIWSQIHIHDQNAWRFHGTVNAFFLIASNGERPKVGIASISFKNCKRTITRMRGNQVTTISFRIVHSQVRKLYVGRFHANARTTLFVVSLIDGPGSASYWKIQPPSPSIAKYK
jgi:hypothetical protein